MFDEPTLNQTPQKLVNEKKAEKSQKPTPFNSSKFDLEFDDDDDFLDSLPAEITAQTEVTKIEELDSEDEFSELNAAIEASFSEEKSDYNVKIEENVHESPGSPVIPRLFSQRKSQSESFKANSQKNENLDDFDVPLPEYILNPNEEKSTETISDSEELLIHRRKQIETNSDEKAQGSNITIRKPRRKNEFLDNSAEVEGEHSTDESGPDKKQCMGNYLTSFKNNIENRFFRKMLYLNNILKIVYLTFSK